jgi:hypothetical protein
MHADGQGLKFVPFSALPEPFPTLNSLPKRLNPPSTLAINTP